VSYYLIPLASLSSSSPSASVPLIIPGSASRVRKSGFAALHLVGLQTNFLQRIGGGEGNGLVLLAFDCR